MVLVTFFVVYSRFLNVTNDHICSSVTKYHIDIYYKIINYVFSSNISFFSSYFFRISV